jgi:predicted transcriptional regulator of viral defense system
MAKSAGLLLDCRYRVFVRYIYLTKTRIRELRNKPRPTDNNPKMPKPSRLSLAKTDILALLTAAATKVYTARELSKILAEHRRAWHLSDSTKPADFVAFLTKHGELRARKLRSTYGGTITRYTWGSASPYEAALTIKPNAYLSHGTAALLHGLTKLDRQTIYLNVEQSKKPPFEGTLTQEGIDRAFANNQRASQLIYAYGRSSIVQLAGKHTNRLDVEVMSPPEVQGIAVTNLERTLIDIAVRPVYAGGPVQVLKAYRAAKNRVSAERLLVTLKALDYAYPYHQSIGFLMEKAGYLKATCEQFRALGLAHDFYLAHRIEDKAYSSEWRLHYPANLH